MRRKPFKYYHKKIDFETTDLEGLSASQLKRVADYWLRKYLLHKAKKRGGKIYCPLKKRWYPESKMHVSHYIDRGVSMHTRYSLKNCHLISESSNVWDAKVIVEGYKSKHHKEYGEYLKNLYGADVLDDLVELSKTKSLFTIENYIETIKFFKNIL